MKKRIIRDGEEMFWCPKCKQYLPAEEMLKDKSYCKICKSKIYRESKKRGNWKRKNEKYKLDVPKDHKYYFKGVKRIKSISIRPRTTGICVNWGKIKYERRGFIDG